MSGSDRLLIRLPNWLGDVLLARPFLHALRRARPAAEIRAIAPATLLDLLAPERVFDGVDPWPPSAAERGDLVRRLRAWRPTAAIVLPPSFSSAWLAWRSGAGLRIGYRHEGRAVLLTHAPPRPQRGEQHLSEEYLALGRPLGAERGALPRLAVADPGQAGAVRVRAERGLEGARYAILGPGAIYGPSKRWGADRFAALGRRLAEQGLRVLVCGVSGERAECEAVASAIGVAAISLAGVTDLAAQAALCAEARVVVCNDSGLAHLSGAVGAPTVAIFGSTSSAWTAPLGDHVRVVQQAPVCSPCFQRRCRIGTLCLAAVEVERVAGACRELAA